MSIVVPVQHTRHSINMLCQCMHPPDAPPQAFTAYRNESGTWGAAKAAAEARANALAKEVEGLQAIIARLQVCGVPLSRRALVLI